ncbi:MAG: hypothetical protein HXS44_08955 [Theionarchaea archaeon]|nr:hypothetical protein [Theionarchaea archaeon]
MKDLMNTKIQSEDYTRLDQTQVQEANTLEEAVSLPGSTGKESRIRREKNAT